MAQTTTRRGFLWQAAAAGTTAGCAGYVSLPGLSGWASDLGSEGRKVVLLPADIEPLVRLLEETPRERMVEVLARRVREGLEQRQLLAALLLAGVRNVEPRPSVGFKFHAVLVAQSVHLACRAARDADRWLPLVWAADYFKSSQEQDERERGWTMGPVEESRVPAAPAAKAQFVEALDRWDEAKADAAIAGLARSAPAADIWEIFFRYGARDFRSIGHKAIDVANSHRVLGVIGWQYAEPILRSLAYALLMHEDGNPADRDDAADRPWRRNQKLASEFPAGWTEGKVSSEATSDLLARIRTGTPEDATAGVVAQLRGGIGARAIWDAMFLASIELLVRQPGIVSLHSVTTTNALHYAYQMAREDSTRRLVLLQNAAFLPMFREAMRGRGKVSDFALDTMLIPSAKREPPSEVVTRIFTEVGADSLAAARRTAGFLQSGGSLDAWAQTALQLIIAKGSDAHDYKFGCAVLEDATSLPPSWRGPYLGGAVFQLQGSGKRDNPLIEQARAALGARKAKK